MGFTIKDEESFNKWGGEVQAGLDGMKKVMAEHDDKIEGLSGQLGDALAVVAETQKQLADAARRFVPMQVADSLLGEELKGALTWDAIHKHPTSVRQKNGKRFEFDAAEKSDTVGRYQDAADQLYMLAAALKMIDSNGRMDVNQVRGLKFYQQVYAPLREKLFGSLEKDGFVVGGASGTGVDWVPSDFSNRLFEKARLPLQVAALLPTFNLPRSPFIFPVELADLTAYLVGEISTAPPILGTTSGYIPDGKGTTAITGAKTFTSRKLATMAFVSKEMEEDSIVAILPYLEMKVVQAINNGKEKAILSGDRAATHMDADVTAATDVRKAFDGIRDYAINVATSGTKDAGGNPLNTDANWRDYARGARKLMDDPYKADNSRLALVVSGNTAIDIGNCEAFRTQYAVGGVATNQNPEITGFRPDGIGSFVVSEFIRSDVAATGVNTAGGPNTFTTALWFYKDAWMLGEERSIRLEVLRERFAEYDVDAVKVTWRGDLQAMLAGNHTVATIDIPAS